MIYLSIGSDIMFCCTSKQTNKSLAYNWCAFMYIQFCLSSQQQSWAWVLDGKDIYCPLAEWVIMVCLFVFLCLVCNLFAIIHNAASAWPLDRGCQAQHDDDGLMWAFMLVTHKYRGVTHNTRRAQTNNNYSVRLSREWSGPHSPSTPGLCWESLQRMAETSHVRWERG